MILSFIILGLLIGPVLLVLLHLAKVRFGIIWVASLAIAVSVWVTLLLLAWELPQTVAWNAWQEIPGLFGGKDWLVLDNVSWPIAFSLITVCLAAVLTSLVRTPMVTSGNLAGILALTGFGMAAVTAGTISALLFAWTALDLFELVFQLSNTSDRKMSERIVASFSGHLMGTMLVLFALGTSGLNSFDLVSLPERVNLLIVLAAGFRLGVLPVQPPLLPVLVPKHGIQALLRLAPVAGTLSLLVRSAAIGLPETWEIPILVLVLGAGLYGAVHWLQSPDTSSGRPYWIVGMASLVVIAVVLRSPDAVAAWSVSLLVGGGLLFLRAVNGPRMRWLYVLAIIMMVGLPFTPSWAITVPMVASVLPWGLVTITLTVLLFTGYLKHAANLQPESEGIVIGVFMIYVGGLALAFASMVFSGFSPLVRGGTLVGHWWPGILILVLISLVVAARRRGIKVPEIPGVSFSRYLSLTAFYRLLWRGYRLSGRGVALISRVLEGQSAVLWALLLLAFLVAVFTQLGIGS